MCAHTELTHHQIFSRSECSHRFGLLRQVVERLPRQTITSEKSVKRAKQKKELHDVGRGERAGVLVESN